MLLPEIFLLHILPDNVRWREGLLECERVTEDLRARLSPVILDRKLGSFLLLKRDDDLLRCDELVIVLQHKLVDILLSLVDMLKILLHNRFASLLKQGDQWPIFPRECHISDLDAIESF